MLGYRQLSGVQTDDESVSPRIAAWQIHISPYFVYVKLEQS